MTTILLDLDNTLLGNDMNDFLPPYFAALHERLSRWLGGRDLRQVMYASVQAMQTNDASDVTNMAAFMADFGPRLNRSPEALRAVLEEFYREDFPHLRQYTTVRPEAVAIVRRLLGDGHEVVIATNPLFPATAIEQRLAWADVGDFSYRLVTTMENSSFSKPNPAYYREILTKVEAEPALTWMVGDDPANDIGPAQAVGLKTWWITDALRPDDPRPTVEPTQQGTLAQFVAWLEAGGLP